jgi:hypothetical protein
VFRFAPHVAHVIDVKCRFSVSAESRLLQTGLVSSIRYNGCSATNRPAASTASFVNGTLFHPTLNPYLKWIARRTTQLSRSEYNKNERDVRRTLVGVVIGSKAANSALG